MKNIVKLSIVIVILSSFAGCDPAKKPLSGPDSASIKAKIDSGSKPVDSTAKVDTAKKDTVKK